MSTKRSVSIPLLLIFGWLAISSFAAHSAAAELRLQAQLIWGTNGEKPDDRQLKPVDPVLEKKLRGVFKWKNYFEVNRQNVLLPSSGVKEIRMSSKCRLELQNLGQSWIEVKLYGKGKLVVTKRQVITPSELVVLAGDDKNDTAWFVILQLAAE